MLIGLRWCLQCFAQSLSSCVFVCSIKHASYSAKLKVLTMMLLRIGVFWDVTLCYWVSGSCSSKHRCAFVVCIKQSSWAGWFWRWRHDTLEQQERLIKNTVPHPVSLILMLHIGTHQIQEPSFVWIVQWQVTWSMSPVIINLLLLKKIQNLKMCLGVLKKACDIILYPCR